MIVYFHSYIQISENSSWSFILFLVWSWLRALQNFITWPNKFISKWTFFPHLFLSFLGWGHFLNLYFIQGWGGVTPIIRYAAVVELMIYTFYIFVLSFICFFTIILRYRWIFLSILCTENEYLKQRLSYVPSEGP